MTARQTKFEPPKAGKVLLVEDEELVGKAIQKDLEKLNYIADWIPDFASAVKALKEQDYHALVTDIFLTGEGSEGLELVKIARDLGIPAVIITSALDLEVAKKGLNNGADHLLEKPFPVDELVKALEQIWENPKGLIARRERYLDQHQLTPKEKELCRLILKGLTNQEIADISGTTVGTVKFYSSQIFEKFEVKNRAELFNLIFPT